MTSHFEASLQRDMDLIRAKIQEMYSQCERALTGAVQALVSGQRQIAYLVILRDQQIDELEEQIDRLCLEFLVRQQPVAGHLRFAYTAIKINAELEKIGDHADSIARRILRLESIRPDLPYEPFEHIGKVSLSMLHDAITAFVERDAELASATMEVEDAVDALRRELDADLSRRHEEGQMGLPAMNLLTSISRRLERVSDKARDICAEVLYMCTGEFFKHRGHEVFRILFVDQHNHCRSQMAEAYAASLDQPRLRFTSAGIDPRPIDPRLPAFLADKGFDITHQHSKSLDQIPHLDHYQVVVVFDERAYRSLLLRRSHPVCIDWVVEDPSGVQGTPDEVRAAYESAFGFIRGHLTDLIEAVVRQD